MYIYSRVSSAKFSGVHIGEHLTWSEESDIQKDSESIIIIFLVRHLIPQHIGPTCEIILLSLIYHYFSYTVTSHGLPRAVYSSNYFNNFSEASHYTYV